MWTGLVAFDFAQRGKQRGAHKVEEGVGGAVRWGAVQYKHTKASLREINVSKTNHMLLFYTFNDYADLIMKN